MNNLLSYCGLIDAKIRASDKYLLIKTENVCQEEEAFEYSTNFKPDINPFETIESEITRSFENPCNLKVEASPANPEKSQKQVIWHGNSEQDCNSPVSEICNKKLSNYKFLNRYETNYSEAEKNKNRINKTN